MYTIDVKAFGTGKWITNKKVKTLSAALKYAKKYLKLGRVVTIWEWK